jgi:hypothetical protein
MKPVYNPLAILSYGSFPNFNARKYLSFVGEDFCCCNCAVAGGRLRVS